MNELLLVSNLLLWLVVIVLAVMVVALARQVGVLHERVAPAGALTPTSGPKVGELIEPMDVDTIGHGRLRIGDAGDLATLVLFVSPTCPVCKALVPTAKRLARQEHLGLVLASDGDTRARHEAYVADLDLDGYPYVLSQALGLAFGVSKLPFAVLIGADGTLAAKGLVNTREHLESLLEAMNGEVATLQEYVANLDDETRDGEGGAVRIYEKSG